MLLFQAGSTAALAGSRPADVPALDRKISGGRLVRVRAAAGFLETRDANAREPGVAYRGIDATTIEESLPVPGLIAWTDIDEIAVRGNAWGVGALTGSITGALTLGTLAGVFLPQEGRNAANVSLAAAYGAVLGATVGAVLGGGVGVLVPTWHRVHWSRSGSGGGP